MFSAFFRESNVIVHEGPQTFYSLWSTVDEIRLVYPGEILNNERFETNSYANWCYNLCFGAKVIIL
jgi:hypothetical protein